MPRTLVFLLGLGWLLPAGAQTLADALAQALARHPQWSALSAETVAAEAGAELAAGVAPGPAAVSVSNLNDRWHDNRGKDEWEVEVGVPLWLPGQRAARRAEAETGTAEVQARREALRLEVAGTLREAWWSLAAARLARELAQRRVDTARALARDVDRRVAAGDLARIDGNLAQGEHLAARGELLEAQAALLAAEQAYEAVTGTPPPAQLTPEPPPGEFAPGPDHPQFAAADAAARLARARLQVAAESRREAPELALRVQRERAEFGDRYGQALGVRLTIPFSSAPRLRRDTAAAEAEAARADAGVVLARQRLALDAARGRQALAVADGQLAMAGERRTLAADNLRLTDKSFALGEADLPALLRARAAAYEAESVFNRRTVARAAAVSRVRQALGVLP